MRKNDKKLKESTLRQKAENSLKRKPVVAEPQLAMGDALKLVHELQVYQEELKMQNEELAIAKRQAIDNAEFKYARLYDFAPLGYYTLNRSEQIIMLNLSGAILLGQDRQLLLHSDFSNYISIDTKPEFKLFFNKVFSSCKKETCDVIFLIKNNPPMHVHLSAIVSENGDECLLSAVDITEQKLAAEVLAQSEKRLQKEVRERTKELQDFNISIHSELIKRKSSQKQLKKSINDYKLLYAYLQKVREEERLNIARIIHDDLAQLLSAMKIELISWKENPDKLDSQRNVVGSMLLMVEQSMAAVTSIIVELRPVLPGNVGLIPALRQLFADFQKHTGITCDIRIEEEGFLIANELAHALYRVVQEALTNIRNHAQATYVTAKISGTASSFSIKMIDNGIGITREKLDDSMSFGIIGMRERIHGMKGNISFKGIPGKGTTVYFKIPIQK